MVKAIKVRAVAAVTVFGTALQSLVDYVLSTGSTLSLCVVFVCSLLHTITTYRYSSTVSGKLSIEDREYLVVVCGNCM